LITGGSGLLGSRLAEIALERGHSVYSGYHQTRPGAGTPVRLDLAEPLSSSKVVEDLKPDLVVHSAALTDVDRCEVDLDLAFRINVEGTRSISLAARRAGSFLIYVSTDYVFDGRVGRYSEEDEPNPLSYYGYTKLLGEQCCHDCIARTCVLYGARPAGNKVNFALWIAERLRKGEEVKVVTDQHITPTLNTNLAGMILESGERRLRGIYHMAGATRVTRYQFACELARALGLNEDLVKPSRMGEMEWKARRPADSSLDTGKAARDLKEKPADLDRSLKMLKEELLLLR
jgi:dTDP-4-dehydrorhamnose reductase